MCRMLKQTIRGAQGTHKSRFVNRCSSEETDTSCERMDRSLVSYNRRESYDSGKSYPQTLAVDIGSATSFTALWLCYEGSWPN